jgi:transcriptional regulator with XRE-family HTH domain
MNAREIQAAAGGFVQQMISDVRNKLNQFLRESGITIRQMARDLGLNEDELDRIQHGDGRVSLETFATLLIANGLVIEVKPISEAPIPTRNGVPVPPRGFDDQQLPPPPPGFFDHVRRGGMPTPGEQPRDARGRFMPRSGGPSPAAPRPAAPRGGASNAPDFAAMEREKLVEIIQNRLWDTEIDVTRASRDQLVRFLQEKDRRRIALEERREQESDPAVTELKDKIKKTLEDNPQLRSVLKQLIG